ncbi:D-tyrosyl-tRNA(Tyr) deacylase [bacterium]|nr:D-tyrosyl-tRNA(Tyr) deacylase [bacterium]
MRAVVQRVERAAVRVGDRTAGEISRGILILLGIASGDTDEELRWTAEKCVNLRIFPDERGRFHYSLLETGGAALVVSQFTLLGDCSRGRRPSFSDAADPEHAEAMVERFIALLREMGVSTESGVFGAMMDVELVNGGPVTLVVDRPPSGRSPAVTVRDPQAGERE